MPDVKNLLGKCFALTGSIGTGKSSVSGMLARLGAHIVDTDLIAREVVEPGQQTLAEIAAYFGKDVINDDGALNREKVRELILRDPAGREKLNGITHPRINAIVMERIAAFNALDDGMPVIIDVPLLYESGWDRIFTDVILVYTPVEVQAERLMARDRLDRDMADLTIAVQMDIEEKRRRAPRIIDNSGTLEQTRGQVETLFRELCDKISGKGA